MHRLLPLRRFRQRTHIRYKFRQKPMSPIASAQNNWPERRHAGQTTDALACNKSRECLAVDLDAEARSVGHTDDAMRVLDWLDENSLADRVLGAVEF